jgi:hypothetical protein
LREILGIIFALLQSACAYSPIANFGIGTTRESPFIERHTIKSSQNISGSSCRGYGMFAGYPQDFANIHEAMLNATPTDPKIDGELFYHLEISKSLWFPLFVLSCYSVEAIPGDVH